MASTAGKLSFGKIAFVRKIFGKLVLGLSVITMVACRAHRDSNASDVRVVGGQFVHMSQDQRTLSHSVSLIARSSTGDGHRCTGVVVGPHQIITAAHCLTNVKELDIGIGPRYWRLPGVKATNIMRHPRWTSSYPYDVGIITFSGDLPSQMKASTLSEDLTLRSGDKVLIAGFGSSGELHPDLRGEFGFLRQVQVDIDLVEPETNSFTIKPYTRKGGCHGDSGGPAFIDRQGQLELVGIISGPSSDAPCDEGHGSITQILRYQGWLKCAFAKAQTPLDSMKDDASSVDCQMDRK